MKHAYIFSVVPYEATRKTMPYGPQIAVNPKLRGERYSVTTVAPASCFKDFGENQLEYYPIPAIDIARDVVKTDCEDQGVWASESPTPEEADIVAAEEKQRAFFDKAIMIADGVWARHGDPTKISFHARVGASELNVRREWAKDTASMKPCSGCRELISKDAAKCGRCGAVMDWDKAIALGMVTEEQYRFAQKRGLVEKADVEEKAPAKKSSK